MIALMVCFVADSRSHISDCRQPSSANQIMGLGYPAKDAAVLEQVERPVKNTLHFGKW